MSSIKVPVDKAGWDRLAGAILKAELAMAGINYTDLQSALREIGVEQNPSNISGKMNEGRFSAVFMLQVLVAIGVEEIELPRRGEGADA